MASNRSKRNGSSNSAASPSPSANSSIYANRPVQPSGLRQSHMPPSSPQIGSPPHPEVGQEGAIPAAQDFASTSSDPDATHQQASIDEPSGIPDARTRLLNTYGLADCGSNDCDHGNFSPRPQPRNGYGSFADSYFGNYRNRPSLGGRYPLGEDPRANEDTNTDGEGSLTDTLGDSITDGLLGHPKKRGTTHWLAKRAGVKHERLMYVLAPSPNHVAMHHGSEQGRLYLSLLKISLGMSSIIFPLPTGSDNTIGNMFAGT